MVLGRNGKLKLHLIDFGSSKRFINKDGTHRKNKIDKKFPGNILFASMNIC